MKKHIIKYVMLFLASFSITSIQASPQSWLEYIASLACSDFGRKIESPKSEEQIRKETAEKIKQEKIDFYHGEVGGLTNAICDKYSAGTLSSNVPIAKVQSIELSVLDPNLPEPKYPFFVDSVLFMDDAQYENWKKTREEYPQLYKKWYRAQYFKLNPSIYATTVTTRFSEGPDASAVYVNLDAMNSISAPYRTQAMLHEIAHVFDGCLRKPKDEHSDCYAWLDSDVKNHPNRHEVDLSEWHAEQQSVEWMKNHYSNEAKSLRKEFKEYVAAGIERGQVPKYPPYAKLVEWLSTYKPLRMKEIKSLGLLWNM